jgi:hypothetical protein
MYSAVQCYLVFATRTTGRYSSTFCPYISFMRLCDISYISFQRCCSLKTNGACIAILLKVKASFLIVLPRRRLCDDINPRFKKKLWSSWLLRRRHHFCVYPIIFCTSKWWRTSSFFGWMTKLQFSNEKWENSNEVNVCIYTSPLHLSSHMYWN